MTQIEIERKITKSKNISLTVYLNGRVVLKHPAKISKIQLENFIAEKQNWILNKLQKIPKDLPKSLKFEDGETIHIFGESVKIYFNDKKTFYDPMNGFYVKKEKNEILRKKRAKHYLKSLLTSKIEPLVKKFEFNLKTKVNKISIRTMRSLWGSCNSKNYISINLSLVHCPDYIIDYIILHEISHTIEHNHSQKFWNLVKSQNPNFKIAEKWLRECGKNYIYYLN
ncbi:M48 family metallopeptidase [Leptospira limi]|uniref:M48 family metallopeptidase n=1 Tax=Leptospira limi TaxID=2950023 RepID=A0ABT3M1L4_9LEPT|nr:SprT family zinc-dependent metalloprotease [Leptospira limi]MCW7463870.1 M48 family metallopeptidase [Leptospira limi]